MHCNNVYLLYEYFIYCLFYRMYYIVEFTEENLVGIVAQCWTYEENGVLEIFQNCNNYNICYIAYCCY